MGDQTNYDVQNLYTPGESPLTGGEPVETDVLSATNWLIAKCRVDQGNFQMQWFGLTNNIFQTLGQSCPLLAPVRKTLGGLRTLLEVVCIGVRLRDHKNSCSRAVLGLFEDDPERAVTGLSIAYHPGYERDIDGTLYHDFLILCRRVLRH